MLDEGFGLDVFWKQDTREIPDVAAISDSTLNLGNKSKAGFCRWGHFLSTSYPVAKLHKEVLRGQQMKHLTIAIRNAPKRIRGTPTSLNMQRLL